MWVWLREFTVLIYLQSSRCFGSECDGSCEIVHSFNSSAAFLHWVYFFTSDRNRYGWDEWKNEYNLLQTSIWLISSGEWAKHPSQSCFPMSPPRQRSGSLWDSRVVVAWSRRSAGFGRWGGSRLPRWCARRCGLLSSGSPLATCTWRNEGDTNNIYLWLFSLCVVGWRWSKLWRTSRCTCQAAPGKEVLLQLHSRHAAVLELCLTTGTEVCRRPIASVLTLNWASLHSLRYLMKSRYFVQ